MLALLHPVHHLAVPTCTSAALQAGSVKEGAARDPKYDYGEDEELHVLITGDRQEDVCLESKAPACLHARYADQHDALVCRWC